MSSPLSTFAALMLGPILGLVAVDLAMRNSDTYLGYIEQLEPGTPLRTDAHRRLRAPEGADIVIVGSSVARRDLDEALIDKALGTRTLNFGIQGARGAVTLMSARDIVVADPEVVVMAVAHRDIAGGVPARELWSYDVGFAAQVWRPQTIYRNLEAHLFAAVASYNMPLRHGRGLVPLVIREWENPNLDNRHRSRISKQDWVISEERIARRVREHPAGHQNLRALKILWSYLKDHDIDLVLVAVPFYPGDLLGPLTQQRDEVLRKMEGTMEVFWPERTYGPNLFHDPLHLGDDGRRMLSYEVAKHLRDRVP